MGLSFYSKLYKDDSWNFWQEYIAFQKVLSRGSFSELPAGPGRFYVVVVTGRFIRLQKFVQISCHSVRAVSVSSVMARCEDA